MFISGMIKFCLMDMWLISLAVSNSGKGHFKGLIWHLAV